MEEIALGIVGGIVVVAVVTKTKILRGATKKLIKTGYALSGASAMDSAKDLMAESKAEFEAGQVAKAEAA